MIAGPEVPLCPTFQAREKLHGLNRNAAKKELGLAKVQSEIQKIRYSH